MTGNIPDEKNNSTAPAKPVDYPELAAYLAELRTGITAMRLQVTALEELAKRAAVPGEVIAEIVIGRRALEDSRMRFGVAEALLKGHNPWENRVSEPAKK